MGELQGRGRHVHSWVALGVLAGIALGGCGGSGSGGSTQVRFDAAPEIAAGPNARAPLVRLVHVETNVPTRIEVVLSDGGSHSFTVASTASSASHSQPILGLKPGRTYDVTITAIAADGERHDWEEPLRIETAALPENFPRLDVTIADRERMEPGFTLLGIRNKDRSASYLVIIDAAGEVVWYADVSTTGAVTQLPNGNLITIAGDRDNILEITMLGEIVRTWYAARGSTAPPDGRIPIDAFDFHHDIIPIPSDDTFLVSTGEVRIVEDFPIDENDVSARATAPVRDEPIVEFRPDGTIVQQWNFLDLLNPRRVGFDATLDLPIEADWVHTNAVILDERDNSLIASLRHQDAVVKVTRGDGMLRWILGPHDNWEGFEQYLLAPVGEPFAWPYHQHAPQVTAEGTLLIFDNGNFKASPFTGQETVAAEANVSRAVEYAIDENARTVRQVWEFVHPERLYAPFVGSAYQLPATRNVLIAFGGLCTINGIPSDDIPNCRGTARILEVVRGQPDTVVFDLALSDNDPSAIGWLVYRANRITRLGGDGVGLDAGFGS